MPRAYGEGDGVLAQFLDFLVDRQLGGTPRYREEGVLKVVSEAFAEQLPLIFGTEWRKQQGDRMPRTVRLPQKQKGASQKGFIKGT